ncbi:sensor histidine kinase [Propionivibrio dicarboxylicus]|uniref:C4-dicarboxylate transport sensor protein DctB n=1 Tax=Propionivibrio dicarboxylicus TaxID=83767 RepID=A0A1G8LH36_9RHOO|nr:ATP-binding protein [Propionivibrio dicarboxylicus]SDI55004.1 two-component system, NtrC family, C4-dicarboxylate transport sensor histidine kinase DctB [Propionivibrio dicarboxylicus]
MGFLAYLSLHARQDWRWLGLRILATAALCGLGGWLVASQVLRGQIDQLGQQSHHRAEFYRQSLESLLSRNTSLPRIIAREDRLKAVLRHPESANARATANRYLADIRRDADINAAFLMDHSGLTLAASNFDQPGSYVGNSYAFRPYFLDAMQNGLGIFYGIGATTGDPGYFLTAPIEIEGQRLGAATVKISLDDFESALTRSGDKVLIADANGVIFLSSIPEWKYLSLAPLDAEAQRRIEASRQYRERHINHLDAGLKLQAAPYSVRLKLPDSPAQNTLVVSVPTGSLGWSILLLTRTGPERQNALFAGIATAFALAFVFSMIIYFRLSVRRHEERVQADARLRQAHQELEQRIAERTADLRATNASLEERIDRLKTTERILRETGDNAVQAGKLAVLGQMAAGISHEVNQPLTAMHTLTDNARDLLDRGDFGEVRSNLDGIKQMAERMGRIAGEIKNFTRKSLVEKQPVPVLNVVCQAAMLVESRRRLADATLTLPEIPETLAVLADPQRLEQVLVNLLLNALDAVAPCPTRHVAVLAAVDAERICIIVRDSGTGIPENALAHLFEPFFTTKSSGQGLGLGLSISRMIVQELGGTIEAHNRENGGADFCITLDRA